MTAMVENVSYFSENKWIRLKMPDWTIQSTATDATAFVESGIE